MMEKRHKNSTPYLFHTIDSREIACKDDNSSQEIGNKFTIRTKSASNWNALSLAVVVHAKHRVPNTILLKMAT